MDKEKLEKELVRQSELFSDYLYLARKMAKHDCSVFFDSILSHLDVSNGINSITLANTQFTDYQWECTVCSEELKRPEDNFSVHRIIDGLKEVFNFELIEESKYSKKQCAITSWNKEVPEDYTHTHYRYRLKFKRRIYKYDN